LEFRLSYSQWYLFNANPDTNHNSNPTNPNCNSNVNPNPTNPTNPTNPDTRYRCEYDNLSYKITPITLFTDLFRNIPLIRGKNP